MGVHPFRPGSHVEVDGKQQRWWVRASAQAVQYCLVPSRCLSPATWSGFDSAAVWSSWLGAPPFHTSQRTASGSNCSSLFREGKLEGGLVWRGQSASGHSFPARRVRLLVAREQWGVLSREKLVSPKPDRQDRDRENKDGETAIGTGRSELSMRCLVQGGQEQDLSLGCGCWWSLGQVGRVPRRRDGRADGQMDLTVAVRSWTEDRIRCQRGDAVSPSSVSSNPQFVVGIGSKRYELAPVPHGCDTSFWPTSQLGPRQSHKKKHRDVGEWERCGRRSRVPEFPPKVQGPCRWSPRSQAAQMTPLCGRCDAPRLDH